MKSTNDLSRLTDEQLYALVAVDDEMAFEELFHRYWRGMYQEAFNVLGDEDVAKDIVQDILMDAWNRRSQKEMTNLKGFLMRSVHFQTLSHLKKSKFNKSQKEALHVISTDSAEEEIYLTELSELVENSIEELPQKCKEVFKLSRFEELSNKEIAQRLNLSPRTVEWHISAALKNLRVKLGTENILFLYICLRFALLD